MTGYTAAPRPRNRGHPNLDEDLRTDLSCHSAKLSFPPFLLAVCSQVGGLEKTTTEDAAPWTTHGSESKGCLATVRVPLQGEDFLQHLWSGDAGRKGH